MPAELVTQRASDRPLCGIGARQTPHVFLRDRTIAQTILAMPSPTASPTLRHAHETAIRLSCFIAIRARWETEQPPSDAAAEQAMAGNLDLVEAQRWLCPGPRVSARFALAPVRQGSSVSRPDQSFGGHSWLCLGSRMSAPRFAENLFASAPLGPRRRLGLTAARRPTA